MAKTSGVWSVLGALVALGFVSGCSDPWQSSATLPNDGVPVADSLTLFRGKVTRASTKVAPIAGGTLLVTRDQHAIASDPDRDQVYVVDLTTEGVMPVALAEGDEPGRAVEGPAGTVYVAARNGGVVAAIDVATATATRIPVCAAPRGLAYDDASATLYVACRSGALVALDTSTNEVAESFQLDGDLRDVVVSGDQLVVSRFKNAEIMVVSRAGEVLRRSTPKLPATGTSLTPTVAYR
ncbi:MAG TPA: cytochrome-c peroxidase, partial [Polyangiaceae bacterium]|nr:cytochrome-c peroxidase [Polyangiaceae bacterium]